MLPTITDSDPIVKQCIGDVECHQWYCVCTDQVGGHILYSYNML